MEKVVEDPDMEILTLELLDAAKLVAIEQLSYAQVAISGHRVGCCVIARHATDHSSFRLFGGSNVELATSRVVHAEHIALMSAIVAGFPKPLAAIITSTHEDQQAAMCGYCMQDFMYANPDCRIYVLDPGGRTTKIQTTVRDRNGLNAYLGKGKLTFEQ